MFYRQIYRRTRILAFAALVVSVMNGLRPMLTFSSNPAEELQQNIVINSFVSKNVEERQIPIPKGVGCRPGVPCEYHDDQQPDIRIIILTHERNNSLLTLLNSLNELEMDGDTAALEIWIDRNKTEHVSSEVISVIDEFHFKHGRMRMHVQEKHVGIRGQWIDTWRPRLHTRNESSSFLSASFSLSDELVLYLEDDMSVSPFAYRWLRAAHRFYTNRTDLAGITLQSHDFGSGKTGKMWMPSTRKLTFLYKLSAWGFAPRASVWRRFQDWYKKKIGDPKFRPYVDGMASTRWYKKFEKRGTADRVWTVWFTYYCHHNKLYTLYSNIRRYDNKTDSCLGINRLEPGLHYSRKGNDSTALLLRSWKNDYIAFDGNITKYMWNGKKL